MCVYMVAGVCVCWQVCVYAGRCDYMIIMLCMLAGVCKCWQSCVYAGKYVDTNMCMYSLAGVWIN